MFSQIFHLTNVHKAPKLSQSHFTGLSDVEVYILNVIKIDLIISLRRNLAE